MTKLLLYCDMLNKKNGSLQIKEAFQNNQRSIKRMTLFTL
jgi:hypothetical protein